MNLLKLLLAGTALGVILTTFRDPEGEWIVPGRDRLGGGGGGGTDDDTEPVLGYSGMDEDDLEDWLSRSAADRQTLLRMIRYEAVHRGRQPVLEALVHQL